MLWRPATPSGRRSLALFLTAGLCVTPLLAGGPSRKPLGMVAEANRAHLGTSSAAIGANVFAGDFVKTDDNGALRLRLGTGELYLSAASYASLEERDGLASVTLVKGSASFSLPNPIEFELETPAGILRGSGENATSGQVAITSAHEIVVTASRGDLILDNHGDLHRIAEGKSFRIVIEEVPSGNGTSARSNRRQKRKLLFFEVAGNGLVAKHPIPNDSPLAKSFATTPGSEPQR
jgi:hypothetical protein